MKSAETEGPLKALPIWPIMLSSLSGSMGFTALMAVLGPLLRNFGYPDWIAGGMISFAGIFWVISSRRWGQVTSRWGCKRLLLAGLIGEGLALLALAEVVSAGLGLVLGTTSVIFGLVAFRAGISIFYSAVPVASSTWVAQSIEPKLRAQAMAKVGAAQGIGMIIGPVIAAGVSHAGLSYPFWAAGMLPFVGALGAWLGLPRPALMEARINKSKLAVTDPRLRKSLLTAFVVWFAIVGAQLTIGFVAIDFLHVEPKIAARAAGFTLASIGVSMFLAQVVVTRSTWSPRTLIRIGAPIAAIGVGFTPVLLQHFSNVYVMCAGFAFGAFGIGFLVPAYQTASVNAVSPGEVGEASGFVSAATGAASVIGPAVVAFLYSLSAVVTYLLVCVLLAGLVIVWKDGELTVAKAVEAGTNF